MKPNRTRPPTGNGPTRRGESVYNIEGVLPAGTVTELEPGTSLLLAGPSMSGKQDIAMDLLAAGIDGDNGLLMVTTNETAASCIDALEERVGSFDRDLVGIVDCSGSNQQQAIRDIATKRVSSPGDLTGISIGTTKLIQQITGSGVSNVCHGLVSISTLLKYLELDTVFKFLHIYTVRIGDTDGLGIFTIDNGSHDQQTINTITKEFDAVVELRESEAGGHELRIRGMNDVPHEWHSM